MAIRGCVLKKAADQTTANYSAPAVVTWDTELYDTHGFHAGSSEKIIIPASMNGLYGIFTSCFSLSSILSTATGSLGYMTVWIRKGGVSVPGCGGTTRHQLGGTGQDVNSAWLNVVSGPQLLTTGEEWTTELFNADNSITVESESTFGLYVIGETDGTMRCLAVETSDQTAQNYTTPAAVPFAGADLYDSSAIHDPASNNTKLIVPAGLNGKYGVVRASVYLDATTANDGLSLAVRKAGSLTYAGMAGNSGRSPDQVATFMWCQTQVIEFATGDEFEALLFCSSDNSITVKGDANGLTSLGLWVYG